MEMCVCVCLCLWAHTCVCGLVKDCPLLCLPINEVCKPSSLKKHSAGHTHFHKHSHTSTVYVTSQMLPIFRHVSCKCLFFLQKRRSQTAECVSIVCVCPFLCPRASVSMGRLGQAVKDWFGVCCFEPPAKCCLANPPCSENKSFSRPPPAKLSSVSVCIPLPTALCFLAPFLVLHSCILIWVLHFSDSALLFANVEWAQHKHKLFLCLAVWYYWVMKVLLFWQWQWEPGAHVC